MRDDTSLLLHDGHTALEVDLVGASIRALTVRGQEVIPPTVAGLRSKWRSGATLAPWPNRLEGGSWRLGERTLVSDVLDADGHAIHGLVGDRLFRTSVQSDSAVTLECVLGSDAVYPYALALRVGYAVDQQGMSATLEARNLTGQRLPVAFGVHPYFPMPAGSALLLAAESVCESVARIPTGVRARADSVGVRPRAYVPTSGLALDHCFTDLRPGADGLVHTRLRYADGPVVDVWQDARLGYVTVFTTHEYPWQTDGTSAIAIEPQSAPANAFNSGEGVQWLEPGQQWRASWGCSIA